MGVVAGNGDRPHLSKTPRSLATAIKNVIRTGVNKRDQRLWVSAKTNLATATLEHSFVKRGGSQKPSRYTHHLHYRAPTRGLVTNTHTGPQPKLRQHSQTQNNQHKKPPTVTNPPHNTTKPRTVVKPPQPATTHPQSGQASSRGATAKKQPHKKSCAKKKGNTYIQEGVPRHTGGLGIRWRDPATLPTLPPVAKAPAVTNHLVEGGRGVRVKDF